MKVRGEALDFSMQTGMPKKKGGKKTLVTEEQHEKMFTGPLKSLEESGHASEFHRIANSKLELHRNFGRKPG